MSRREPSLGANSQARRGPQREHIPYRGDDLGRGKKTGKQVKEVPRDSDGIEPFDKVLSQMDQVTPPNGRRRNATPRRSTVQKGLEFYEVDENGSVDMEIDETTPTQYFSNARNPLAPPSDSRIGSASNRLQRNPDVDFDSIPSPSSHSRVANHTSGTSAPSTSRRTRRLEDISVSQVDFDNTELELPRDGESPMGSAQMSFTHINEDYEDDADKENEQQNFLGSRTTIGGAEESGDFEDAIADIENQHRDGFGEDMDDEDSSQQLDLQFSRNHEGHRTSKSKNKSSLPKTRTEDSNGPTKPRGPRKRRAVNNREASADESGLRRGSRVRVAPLEWWRCERIIYGRESPGKGSGKHAVPVMKGVIRLPKEEPQPLGTQKRKRTYKKRVTVVDNPEAGWDDETDPQGIVLDYETQEEVTRRVAFTASMVEPRAGSNDAFFYQKIFGDGEFIAAGQLIIPPNSQKPSKTTKDNTYVFFLFEGAIQLKVHRTSYILSQGAMFLVPRGNNYWIENISERDAKLFFAQARKIPLEEMAEDEQ